MFFSVSSISASLNVLPAMQPGHRVTVQVNGRKVAEWPESSTSYLLQNLFRGSYSLLAQILDATGKPVCTSHALNFHIRQPSMLTPGAKAAPR